MNDLPPDLFFDSYQFGGGVLGISVSLYAGIPHPADGRPTPSKHMGVLRMAPQTAKIFAFHMARQVKQAEAVGGEITISPAMLNNCSIGPEDWATFWARVPEIKG